MKFDISKFKKKKKPMASVSGGLRGITPPSPMSSRGARPSLGKGQSTQAADALANMGFGKGMKVT